MLAGILDGQSGFTTKFPYASAGNCRFSPLCSDRQTEPAEFQQPAIRSVLQFRMFQVEFRRKQQRNSRCWLRPRILFVGAEDSQIHSIGEALQEVRPLQRSAEFIFDRCQFRQALGVEEPQHARQQHGVTDQ